MGEYLFAFFAYLPEIYQFVHLTNNHLFPPAANIFAQFFSFVYVIVFLLLQLMHPMCTFGVEHNIQVSVTVQRE
jgi:hypothetical protein